MPFFYTCISVIANVVLLPLLLPVALVVPKDRRRKLLQRLGLALTCPKQRATRSPVLWIHALSVGEVTSALPLIHGLRQAYPDALIYLTVTTSAGFKLARNATGNSADRVLFAPLDLFFAIQAFLQTLAPDLFILVETDFWPEWLRQIHARGIPAMLVNGRFSARSMQRYQRFRQLFQPMFSCFSVLATQTREDSLQLQQLGVPADKIHSLGNLKFDAGPVTEKDKRVVPLIKRADLQIPEQARVIICGSTHPGEEEIILSAFTQIRKKFPTLLLIIAPRDIDRAEEIVQLARQAGYTASRRSQSGKNRTDLLVLDTIGELAACYHLADLAFIGGSLVPEGGHNPIEAAIASIPVLFGPHMEDFSEISAGLIRAGGAFQVHNSTELAGRINDLLTNPDQAADAGRAARDFVRSGQGVVNRHLAVIKLLLAQKNMPER